MLLDTLENLRSLLRNISADMQALEESARDPALVATVAEAEGHVTLACAKLSRAIAQVHGR